MSRSRGRLAPVRLLSLAALVSLSGCGGSDNGPTDPPPAVEPVASVEVTPATGSLLAGETLQLTATLRDAAGATLTGRDVTWSSNPSSVASVSSTGLVTGLGAGSATITATSEGRSGNAAVEVTLASFSPTEDTELSGTANYQDFTIPAGVTVTVTADAVVGSEGPVTIEGDLVGDCVGLSITGGAAVTLAGAIRNDCSSAPEGGGPDLTIVGNGDLMIDGVDMASSGSIDIKNDPTLSGAAFVMAEFSPFLAIEAKEFNCTIMNYTVVTGLGAAAGAAGSPNGANGSNGTGFAFGCNGDLSFKGNVQIETESGGAGGKGTDVNNTGANAMGGTGGQGGILTIRSTGDMTFTDEVETSEIPNHFFSGSGGPGGDADATAQANPQGNKAPNATATGGAGGMAGAVDFQVGGNLTVAEGSFFAGPGLGGDGGSAVAKGADGDDATDTRAAQEGGNGTATGGMGGGAPGFQTLILGDAVGFENLVFDDAADAGWGGDGDAYAGTGGNGNQMFKPGGAGGAVTAQGGAGGDAGSGFGGSGGWAFFSGAHGGDGWDDCEATIEPGGDGGAGGAAGGGDGAFGAGLNPGAAGEVVVNDIGDGGDGGDGEAPGAGGTGGTDNIVSMGARTDNGVSFEDGDPGSDCHSGSYNVEISVLSDPGGHDPFINLRVVSSVFLILSDFDASANAQFGTSGSSPWVDVSGSRDADGNVSASGRGVVAGFSDIAVVLSGTLSCTGEFSFEYTMGAEGGLPGGSPITYLVIGSMSSASGAAGAPALGGCAVVTGSR